MICLRVPPPNPENDEARDQAGSIGKTDSTSPENTAPAAPAQARYEVRITSAVTGAVKVFSVHTDEAEADAIRRKIAKHGGCVFVVEVRP
jgi:hypothetical protein